MVGLPGRDCPSSDLSDRDLLLRKMSIELPFSCALISAVIEPSQAQGCVTAACNAAGMRPPNDAPRLDQPDCQLNFSVLSERFHSERAQNPNEDNAFANDDVRPLLARLIDRSNLPFTGWRPGVTQSIGEQRPNCCGRNPAALAGR